MPKGSTNIESELPETPRWERPSGQWVDLCRRVGEAGLTVTLFWAKSENNQDLLWVDGYIPQSGTTFELPVESSDPTKLGEKALNLFYHPLGRLAHIRDKSGEELFVNERALNQKAA